MSISSKLSKVPKYLRNVMIHDLGISPSLPTFVNFSVSNRCNARCVMCDIWKYPSDDKTGEQLRELLSHQYLKSVESFGITGGEPFVRKDLIDVVRYAISGMPKIKQISITTNGFNTHRIKRYVKRILEHAEPAGIKVSITVSLDAVGDLHSQIRGVPGVWDKVLKSILMLRDTYGSNIDLRLASTVTRYNAKYDELDKLYSYSLLLGVPIIFRMAVLVDRIFNDKLISSNGVMTEAEARGELKKFIEAKLLGDFNPRKQYYEMIRDLIDQKITDRSVKCMEMRDGGMLDSNGELYVCSVSGVKIGSLLTQSKDDLTAASKVSRAKVRCDNCKSCYHDHQSHNPLMKTIIRVLTNV